MQDVRGYRKARALHLHKHRQKRHLEPVEELRAALSLERLLKRPAQLARKPAVERRLGQLGRRLKDGLSTHKLSDESCGLIGASVALTQVIGHTRVKDTGGVNVLGLDRHGLRRVDRTGDVQKCLHVGRYHPTLTHERRHGLHRRDALKVQECLWRRQPDTSRERLGKERDLSLALGRPLDGSPHPLPLRDCLRKRGFRFLARERLGQLGPRLRRLCPSNLAHTSRQLGQPPCDAREAQGTKGPRDLGGVEGREPRVLQAYVDRRIRADGGHLAREQGILDVGTKVLAHLALDLVGMGNDLVEATVAHDERRRLLRADPRDAGDIVRRVALEAVEVRHEPGRNAVVEVIHALGRHDAHLRDALFGRDDPHALGRELVHVAIPREEIHLIACLLARARECAQDVITLPALALHDGHIEHAQQILDHGELLAQSRVHGRALGLVLWQQVYAYLRLSLVEGTDYAVGAKRVHELDEHVEEAEERVGGSPVGRAHGLADGVKRTVHERIAIDDGNRAPRRVFRCACLIASGTSSQSHLCQGPLPLSSPYSCPSQNVPQRAGHVRPKDRDALILRIRKIGRFIHIGT